jgi:AraC family transcriptional regulator of adaptative response/methylated-DNA-[protein]-cysteine methyltransferase
MSRTNRIDWASAILETCRALERSTAPGALDKTARTLGVGAAELRRQFSRRLGVAPKAYANALALQRLAQQAGDSRTALDALLAAGFESSTRGYAQATRALGAPPGQLRRGVEIGWWLGLSELGWMLMGATAKGVCWLAFGDAPAALLAELRAAYPRARLVNDERRLRSWFDAVRDYVLLPAESLSLPVDVRGTAFQSRVWRALRDIPLGATVSYGELAQRIGRPSAARAVASACASNRVAIVIPCHRVTGARGQLAGYRWGTTRKARLLGGEAIAGTARGPYG